MRTFRGRPPHGTVMAKLARWCDEAAVAHWDGEVATDWNEIYARLIAGGRSSRVRKPTEAHKAKRFAPLKRWVPEQPIVKAS
jgi:hypothetical protein